MKLDIPKNISPADVAKRAMFLAYESCGPAGGMGVFQAREGVTEEDVWQNVATSGDYPGDSDNVISEQSGDIFADYVFGRMMKVGCEWNGQTLTVSDREATPDYQEWCTTYPTYEALFQEAINQLKE